jgi:peptide/nickel transport system substrate-binding protein
LAGVFVAALATPASAGGRAAAMKPTLNIAVDSTDVDHSDPALSYSVLGWQMEQETCDTLVGFSDHSGSVGNSISPLAAAAMPVITNGGKTYTFTIRSGLHFSNGDAVTAAKFKYAFDRDALKNLNSPVTAFMGDVVGWTAENDNSSIKSVAGVVASGQELTIKLVKPDGTILPKLALPFFCPLTKNSALWTGSQWLDSNYNGAFPGNGPYYLASRTVGEQMVLQRNTHYSGPKLHKANAIVMNMNVRPNTAYDGISNGTYAADANGNPEPANNKQLFDTYGKNKTQFWVEPTSIISYLVMNEARPTFQPSHLKLRQAVNMVVDRPGFVNISGFLSGTPQTQVLPKALAGSHWKANYAYPITTPNQARFDAAKTLGNNCDNPAHITFLVGQSSTTQSRAVLIGTDLERIGCIVTDISECGYQGCYGAAATKGAPWDIFATSWSDDFPDGYDWFGILFNGRTIRPNNNNDLAYMNNATVNRRTDACNKLSGSARANCWGALDQWMTANVAPWATLAAVNFVDYIAPNAHNYHFDAPLASADLGLLYQS